MFRLVLSLVAALAIGAVLGLLAGLCFGFPGGWVPWAGGGVAVAVAVLGLLAWSIGSTGNIIAGALLAGLLVVLMQPGPAAAETRMARAGDAEVRIFDGPCIQAETLMRIPEAMREEFHKATGRFDGKTYFGCWREAGEGVFLLWEDGDQGIVPADDLKPVPTT